MTAANSDGVFSTALKKESTQPHLVEIIVLEFNQFWGFALKMDYH